MCVQPNYVAVYGGDCYYFLGRSPKVLVSEQPDCKIIQVPCNHCIECYKHYSLVWAYRSVLERSLHKDACMVDLTYNDAHLPNDGVQRRDLQLFLKRLRKHISPVKVRYFACGEYGGKNHRPHYHVLLFGWKPSDCVPWKLSKRGTQIYRSAELEKLWTFGFSDVTDVTFEAGMYAAKYLQKTLPTPVGCNPAFTAVSTHPGLGAGALTDKMYQTGHIYYNGKHIYLPRYFLGLYQKRGYDVSELKSRRISRVVSDKQLRVKREKLLNYFGQIS